MAVLLLGAVILAVLIKSFLIQPFEIPSQSMHPTLQVGDRVMVSKVSYLFGEPARGDVVVFSPPGRPEPDRNVLEVVWHEVREAFGWYDISEAALIKRVIATGGDRVEIRRNQVWVNGRLLEERYLGSSTQEETFTVDVEEDHIFVMGDHRAKSSDSRAFGTVHQGMVVGKAVFRIWPLGRLGGI
ncbi:MAG: signal peptidase I [Acidimicrobiia bacterium]|nr:signal peptidase I [bacterium]MXX02124.1 signal peptidase I [Acidimicrobiia bacterium]MXX45761.1 signal peptidase I [Acidimicrobiia bacterium]MYA40073.1 signal peptidase I [Acidimicrobiia bacterium]MYB79919.1 signal peptidase I [Acidimicrobiia bacterium]